MSRKQGYIEMTRAVVVSSYRFTQLLPGSIRPFPCAAVHLHVAGRNGVDIEHVGFNRRTITRVNPGDTVRISANDVLEIRLIGHGEGETMVEWEPELYAGAPLTDPIAHISIQQDENKSDIQKWAERRGYVIRVDVRI